MSDEVTGQTFIFLASYPSFSFSVIVKPVVSVSRRLRSNALFSVRRGNESRSLRSRIAALLFLDFPSELVNKSALHVCGPAAGSGGVQRAGSVRAERRAGEQDGGGQAESAEGRGEPVVTVCSGSRLPPAG